MNCPVDYKEEITCEYVDNTTCGSDTNISQTGKPNVLYMSYSEATMEKIKTSMASPQECI